MLQEEHTRSDTLEGARASNDTPNEHVVSAVHTRSDVSVAHVLSYCIIVHVVSAVHTRLLVEVWAADTNCVLVQVVTTRHTRLLVDVGAVDSY